MIATYRIVRRWLPVCLLLLVIHARCAKSNPIIRPAITRSRQLITNRQVESLETTGGQTLKRLCGADLATALREACVLFPSLFDQAGDGKGHSAVDECCKKPCSEKTLHGFCRKVRSPPLNKGSTERENVPEESINTTNNEPTTLEPIITTPTDPTSRPEFAYAGEFWDQEPLTLLPTYTSPDYTMNVMQRL